VGLDNKDLKILDILRADAKKTTQQISRELNIPITTIHNRIKKMERDNIIEGYTVKVRNESLGKNLSARLCVRVSSNVGDEENICRTILKFEEVESVYMVTGEDDLIVKIRVADVNELHDFIMTKLRQVDGVASSSTIIVLRVFMK
tara:strand:+ start:143 stop:580 length:438 start_codon:yes stop_codon:yes gene_type:complete